MWYVCLSSKLLQVIVQCDTRNLFDIVIFWIYVVDWIHCRLYTWDGSEGIRYSFVRNVVVCKLLPFYISSVVLSYCRFYISCLVCYLRLFSIVFIMRRHWRETLPFLKLLSILCMLFLSEIYSKDRHGNQFIQDLILCLVLWIIIQITSSSHF